MTHVHTRTAHCILDDNTLRVEFSRTETFVGEYAPGVNLYESGLISIDSIAICGVNVTVLKQADDMRAALIRWADEEGEWE